MRRYVRMNEDQGQMMIEVLDTSFISWASLVGGGVDVQLQWRLQLARQQHRVADLYVLASRSTPPFKVDPHLHVALKEILAIFLFVESRACLAMTFGKVLSVVMAGPDLAIGWSRAVWGTMSAEVGSESPITRWAVMERRDAGHALFRTGSGVISLPEQPAIPGLPVFPQLPRLPWGSMTMVGRQDDDVASVAFTSVSRAATQQPRRPQPAPSSFAGACYLCSGTGHKARDCPRKGAGQQGR
jgi:hypothetical protein